MVDHRVGAFSKTVSRKGTGLETPNYGSTCKVKLKIFCEDGNVLENCEKQVVIGEGDSEAAEYLDKCLEYMHVEEICVIPYNREYLAQDCGVASEGDLKCEIELLSFFKAKEPWETTSEEKLSIALHHKTKGTDCFKSGKWFCAARRYSQALKQLILIQFDDDLHSEDQDQLRVSCLLNLSACQGKLGQCEFVVANCTKVLEVSPTNIKALYRRGQAFVVLNEFEKARMDLEKASTIDPSNKAVQDQLRILKEKERNHDKKMSRALGAMFGRKV